MIQKPERPYKNLEEFRVLNLNTVGFIDPNAWPCVNCRGQGCEVCGNSGKGTKEACKQAYKAQIDNWKAEVEIYKLYKSALSKLTKEELAVLQACGLK